MALITKSDRADMVERILAQSMINSNKVYYWGYTDFEALVWHYLQTNPIDRFTHRGTKEALDGCVNVYSNDCYTLGVRDNHSLEIFLERI